MNFIAFRFTDNDFHTDLRNAVNTVNDNLDEDLSEQSWFEYIVIAMDYSTRTRRVSNDLSRLKRTHEDYFRKTLEVKFVEKLEELRSGFEGYIIDTNLGNVFYYQDW